MLLDRISEIVMTIDVDHKQNSKPLTRVQVLDLMSARRYNDAIWGSLIRTRAETSRQRSKFSPDIGDDPQV